LYPSGLSGQQRSKALDKSWFWPLVIEPKFVGLLPRKISAKRSIFMTHRQKIAASNINEIFG